MLAAYYENPNNKSPKGRKITGTLYMLFRTFATTISIT